MYLNMVCYPLVQLSARRHKVAVQHVVYTITLPGVRPLEWSSSNAAPAALVRLSETVLAVHKAQHSVTEAPLR
jgi:hypothetical protein